ncbi:metal ABC transporter substrate-binding protein [Kytococcus sedentarius]|uniref:metal ABC transporter substrate-binding protein n=1 Tax=Kytococcus sedentarius TaxID=1276 RepID=UPI0035BC8775
MRRHLCPPLPRRVRWGAAALATTVALAGCGQSDEGAEGGGAKDGQLAVSTGFFPLTQLVEKVGGEHVAVTQVTPDGSNPHHLEMSPRTTGQLQEADLVVHLATMQPALDSAIDAVAADHAWDVGAAVDLEAGPQGEGGKHEGHDHAGEGTDDHEGHDHADGDHEGHDRAEEGEEGADDHADHGHAGHDHGGVDPHFWLDPLAYAQAAEALGEQLAERDPDHAEDYRANAAAFVEELEALDEELAQGFASCSITDLVVGHEAYGWFSARYGFHQLGVAGIANGAEVSPARLAELTEVVREAGVTTIYAEPLTPRDNAEALAAETGTAVETIDPVAGLSEGSAADDYLGLMRANAETLRAGQECS